MWWVNLHPKGTYFFAQVNNHGCVNNDIPCSFTAACVLFLNMCRVNRDWWTDNDPKQNNVSKVIQAHSLTVTIDPGLTGYDVMLIPWLWCNAYSYSRKKLWYEALSYVWRTLLNQAIKRGLDSILFIDVHRWFSWLSATLPLARLCDGVSNCDHRFHLVFFV